MSGYLKGEVESVITCKPLPDCILARKAKESLNNNPKKKRILVTEDSRLPVTVSGRKTDPFRPKGYRFKDSKCIVEEGRYCDKQSVIYEITCIKCNLESNQEGSRKSGKCDIFNYIGVSRTSVH